MIAGVPGAGKSEAVKSCADQYPAHCIYIQAVRGEGTPWSFAHSLGNHWGYAKPSFGSVQEARMAFGPYFPSDSLLIVDESQYLHQKNRHTGKTGEALEWVRGLAETWGFQVALCGDLDLVTAVASMPQLQSRMRRSVIIKRVNARDVSEIVDGTGWESREAMSALSAIAKHKGGLRNVENVIRVAELFAGNDMPQLAHLKAAIVDMKLAPKGGFK